MHKSIRLLILSFSVLLFAFCGQNNRAVPVTPEQESNHKVKVLEVLQSDSYTYLNVSEGFKEYWIATAKNDFQVNDELYYLEGLEMRNLDSKELERTFEKIVFVDLMSKDPIDKVKQAHAGSNKVMMGKSAEKINIEKVENGISLSDLFSALDKYSSQEVIVRGKIVKYNAAILGKNWIHIQDGTDFNGNFDLTITSESVVNVGDTVTFKGTINLNKDFGSGYTYDVIMEEASIVE